VPDLMELYGLDLPELKDKPLKAVVPPALRNKESLFDAIKKQDVLLHHPYTAFGTIVDFIQAAAHDPQVVAIKMCLYRTGKNSPIPQALMAASERGKQVTAVVEIKARFDEEHNIEWAKRLAESGVHVVYGVVGLKTHSKVALVVRREQDGLKTYTHIATGNYNPTTSRLYTDLGLLTSDSASATMRRLVQLSDRLFDPEGIQPADGRAAESAQAHDEVDQARDRTCAAGKPAHITAKVNRLTDLKIIEALYEASQAGVKIDLIVRGACMIRPGEPGLSRRLFTSGALSEVSSNTVASFTSRTAARKKFTLDPLIGWHAISIVVLKLCAGARSAVEEVFEGYRAGCVPA
jgi:polyphosphate kinase